MDRKQKELEERAQQLSTVNNFKYGQSPTVQFRVNILSAQPPLHLICAAELNQQQCANIIFVVKAIKCINANGSSN